MLRDVFVRIAQKLPTPYILCCVIKNILLEVENAVFHLYSFQKLMLLNETYYSCLSSINIPFFSWG